MWSFKRFRTKFRKNVKAKIDTTTSLIIGAVMIGSVMLSTIVQQMFFSGINEPVAMGYEIPVVSGALTAVLFIVLYKYVLNKNKV